MLYKGSCHCGNMTFEVEGELTQVVSCNCSICARKGALLWSVPRNQLRLLGSGAGVGSYSFNTNTIAHRLATTQGGAIRYTSRPGGGSVFSLRFPRVDAEEVSPIPL